MAHDQQGHRSMPDYRSSCGYGIPPMFWNEDGELDAKACMPFIEQLWGSYAIVIATRQEQSSASRKSRS